MQKEMKLIDFEEVYEQSEKSGLPILRVLYDEYIPKKRYTNNENVSIIYMKKKRVFAIYF